MNLQKNQSVIIAVPVWGKEYIKTFFEICLPFFFTENNLIYLKNEKKYSSKFIIYTYRMHEVEIKKFNSFNKLLSLINVNFLFIDDLKFEVEGTERQKQFCAFIACHKNIIKEASKNNSIMLFFNADVIFSENMIRKIFYYIENGFRAICVSGLRLAKKKVIEIIKKNQKYNFSSRELVKIALENLHPVFANLNWEKKKIPACLSILFWQLDDHNILLRSFHLHPLAIWPEKDVVLKTTIDDNFLFESCSSSKIKVIEDSDEFVLFELTDENDVNILGPTVKKPYLYLLKWGCSLLKGHWKNFEHIIFYKTDCYSLKWKKIERKSDLFFFFLKLNVIIYKFLNKYIIFSLSKIFIISNKFINLIFLFLKNFINKTIHLLKIMLPKRLKYILKKIVK